MTEFGELVRTYSLENKTIVGYGVPTKATLMLSLASLSRQHIDFFVEDNNLKTGRFTPVTAIPIHSVEKLKSTKPSIIIIFAWNFSDDIISNIRKIVNWPVKCIVPLPSYKEISI